MKTHDWDWIWVIQYVVKIDQSFCGHIDIRSLPQAFFFVIFKYEGNGSLIFLHVVCDERHKRLSTLTTSQTNKIDVCIAAFLAFPTNSQVILHHFRKQTFNLEPFFPMQVSIFDRMGLAVSWNCIIYIYIMRQFHYVINSTVIVYNFTNSKHIVFLFRNTALITLF